MQRVVMPVYDGRKLVYWQARGFNPALPKYINPIVDKHKLVARFGAGPVLALTEDILSAFKVSRVTEAWALMGTSIPDGVLAMLGKDGRPVAIMLDPDKAGLRAAAKAHKQLGAVGIEATVLHPPKDPKLLTPQEIISCVNSFPALSSLLP